MLSLLMGSVYESTAGTTSTVDGWGFLMSLLAAIGLGMIIALVYQYKNIYTKSFVVTLALLPAVVASVIVLVNGNLGAGVAVAGAFSLVRFRSAPGGAKEIYAVFLSMAIGLATGMGYIGYAVLITVILSVVSFIYEVSALGTMKQTQRQLMIMIPENIDYEEVFDDVLDEMAQRYELISIRTSDMGSLFKLKYLVQLNPNQSEKAFIDTLRKRNGNLEVSLSRNFTKDNEL